jgi:hypothetical protein
VLCEVLRIHIDESVLDENGAIDQYKIDWFLDWVVIGIQDPIKAF